MNFWDIVSAEDSETCEKILNIRKQICEGAALERKYRELIMTAINCVLRNHDGIVLHGKEALKYGATREQVFAAVEQSFLTAGIPALKAGAEAFAVIFPE